MFGLSSPLGLLSQLACCLEGQGYFLSLNYRRQTDGKVSVILHFARVMKRYNLAQSWKAMKSKTGYGANYYRSWLCNPGQGRVYAFLL